MIKDEMKQTDRHYQWLEDLKKDIDRACGITEEIWQSIPMDEKEEYVEGSLAHKISELMDILHNI